MSKTNLQDGNLKLLLLYILTKPVGFVVPVALLLISPLYVKDLFTGLGMLAVCVAYVLFAAAWYKSKLISKGEYASFVQDLRDKKLAK